MICPAVFLSNVSFRTGAQSCPAKSDPPQQRVRSQPRLENTGAMAVRPPLRVILRIRPRSVGGVTAG
jgi:hypothetical protein